MMSDTDRDVAKEHYERKLRVCRDREKLLRNTVEFAHRLGGDAEQIADLVRELGLDVTTDDVSEILRNLGH
jgi:hypothetical protein